MGNVNGKNNWSVYEIQNVCINGDWQQFQVLISNPDIQWIDWIDEVGNTYLHYASQGGNMNIVKYLVENGLHIGVKSNQSELPIHVASTHGHLDVIKYFVSNGVDINVKTMYSQTLLMDASQNRHLNIVKYLVENGAQIDTTNEDGRTALFHFGDTGSESQQKEQIQKKYYPLNSHEMKTA